MKSIRSIDFWPEASLLSYETQRVLAMSPSGGADPGEVMWTASRIDPANAESWQAQWAHTAMECENIAENAKSSRTARDAYLRACNYWRQAGFFIPFDDPRRAKYHSNSQRCFRSALPNLDSRAEVVEIPYKGNVLDGYLLHPVEVGSEPAPVVIFGGTIDSTSEEKYFAIGRMLCERGFAVLLWDGPGQGSSLVLRGIESEASQKDAVSATIDWLATRVEVDVSRLGLIGWGAGGYYSLETAAREPRVAAAVAWCMIYDFSDPNDPELPGSVRSLEDYKEKAVSGQLGNPILFRYSYEWSKKRTAGDWEAVQEKSRAHSLKGVLKDAKRSILILMGGEDSISFHGDGAAAMSYAQRAMSELGSSDKTFIQFSAEGPGSRHVQADGMERGRAVIADWLSERLKPMVRTTNQK